MTRSNVSSARTDSKHAGGVATVIRRVLLRRFLILVGLLLIAACVVIGWEIVVPLALFSLFDVPSHDEVARVTSPDGLIDAVLVESNGGATDPFWYDVYLVPKGLPYSNSASAVYLSNASRNADADGADLRWETPLRLEVRFLQADKATVRNTPTNVAGRQITVVLGPGISDASAPSGGMLYNLHHRH